MGQVTTVSTLHFCTSDSWGGLEIYACALMHRLQSAGCGVVAVCKPRSRVEEYLIAHNIPTVRLPSYGPFSIATIREIRAAFQRYAVQIVHVHFHKDIWPASFALRRDSSRRLFLSMYMGVGRKNDFWHRYIYRRVDGFFSSSATLVSRLPVLYAVPKEKVHFLPYGRILNRSGTNTARRHSIRSALGVKPSDILVGTMVRIDPGKGVIDFIESYRYLEKSLKRKVRFLIVGEPTRKGRMRTGDSPFEPRCEEYLEQLHSLVVRQHLASVIHFVGFQQDVVGYLSAMDIFVFPSRDELFSLVMLDAMALPLPIVAARAGGNLQQIRDGVNGLLYEVANPEDLAAKIGTYINNSRLRKLHQHAARKFVEDYHDMDKTIDRLLTFYTSESAQ